MSLLSPLEKHLNRCYRRGDLVLERLGDIKVKKKLTTTMDTCHSKFT